MQKRTSEAKHRAKGRTVTSVVFELPTDASAESVHLCGEFNNWSLTATPMSRESDSIWRVEVDLEAGHSYRFRYLIDGERWENDWAADAYVENPYGSDDSVVTVTTTTPSRS